MGRGPDRFSVLIAALLAGMASTGCAAGGSGPRVPGAAPAVTSGQQVAEAKCAGCHATGLSSESPRIKAPPFRALGRQFNAITWERALAEIAGDGHDEMPPLRLDAGEIRDLEAYVKSLR